jgi:hypothetical protein
MEWSTVGLHAQTSADQTGLQFIGQTLSIPAYPTAGTKLTSTGNDDFRQLDDWMEQHLPGILPEMTAIRERQQLCDWFYYQLIRRVADQIIRKADDYRGYTMSKWHLLRASGFDPLVVLEGSRIWLYVQTEDTLYNLPGRIIDGRQYICINAHDYEFDERRSSDQRSISAGERTSAKPFSFTIDRLPEFPENAYQRKAFVFNVGHRREQLDVSLNTALPGLLRNYPVTDYRHHFNIPLSRETQASLVSQLRRKLERMNTPQGIEYLLQFTRHAFPFATDTQVFGREKRLSPEETLLYETSDCEDRAALFFYLVKEIYDLPMVVLTFPNHVSVAVDLKQNRGQVVRHEGREYTLCEPTPQRRDLKPGESLKGIHDGPFEVSYAYRPADR